MARIRIVVLSATRADLVTGIMLLVLIVITSHSRAADASTVPPNVPPNFVVIVADDLRYDLLGCTGHPFARTPHIDRIAAEGANFRNFFATTPLCSPSRASFLTGMYPHTHRIVNNDAQGLSIVSHRLMTFPRILREQAGYVTGWVGKWHMGLDDSRRPGFDYWVSFKGQGQFIDPVVNYEGRQIQTDGYLTDLITEWSVEFLRRKHDRPFCLVVSHEAVHRPFLPAERHENDYSEIDVTPPPVDRQQLSGKKALTRPATTARRAPLVRSRWCEPGAG